MAAKKPTKSLTDAELLVLGLVAEMPRHGYELDQEIERRGMREWTPIGFSSVYFVLGKLQTAGFISAKKPAGDKARKTFTLTAVGRRVLVKQTIASLGSYRPTYSSALLGMLHWPALEREQALDALKARGRAVGAEQRRTEQIRMQQQPLPDFVDALFDFAGRRLEAESEWITNTLEYMQSKPWLE